MYKHSLGHLQSLNAIELIFLIALTSCCQGLANKNTLAMTCV